MTVKDVQTEQVVTCGLDTNLAAAIAILWENGCGALPVIDDNGKVAGMLTDRHICIALGTRDTRPSDLAARDVMETRLATCKSSDHVRSALQIMRKAKVRRLPVVTEDGVVEGIVSIDDIVRNIRRDFGRVDAVSCGEMLTALQEILTRNEEASKKHAQDGRGVKRPPEELRSVSSLMVARSRALCASEQLAA
jgi:CBS domain-containing protein